MYEGSSRRSLFLLDSFVAPYVEPSGFSLHTSERLGDALCSLVRHGRIGGAPCMESQPTCALHDV